MAHHWWSAVKFEVTDKLETKINLIRLRIVEESEKKLWVDLWVYPAVEMTDLIDCKSIMISTRRLASHIRTLQLIFCQFFSQQIVVLSRVSITAVRY